jgi:levansucrase
MFFYFIGGCGLRKRKKVYLILVVILCLVVSIAFYKTFIYKVKIKHFYVVKKTYLYNSDLNSKKRIKELEVNNKISTSSPKFKKMYYVTYKGIKGYVYSKKLSPNYVSYERSYGAKQITRHEFSLIPKQQNNEKFKVPNFSSKKIDNIPTAYKTIDGKKITLDVWDSWPLQNADGTVAKYKGYNLVFALSATPNIWDTKIYLFYQKAGESDLSLWKNAGEVFNRAQLLNSGKEYLKLQTQEWSGSAVRLGNDIRLFYTVFSDKQTNGKPDFNQTLSTAKIDIEANESGLKVKRVTDYKPIFNGDGNIYQSIEQFRSEGLSKSGDNHALRDPHYVESRGRKYLVFEANTGGHTGYQDVVSLYNRLYYGGNRSFFTKDRSNIIASKNKNKTILANAAIGMIELNNNFSLKKVMKPLLTANLVTDEIERPNIVLYGNKWYLFGITKGYQQRVSGFQSDHTYMIGYVSNHLTGPYKPLNKTGLVLSGQENFNSRLYTYSYYAIPTKKNSKKLLITSYMTNQGTSYSNHQTFAPSFLLNLSGDQTYVQKKCMLEQGQLTEEKN